jgi:hypothetical protein
VKETADRVNPLFIGQFLHLQAPEFTPYQILQAHRSEKYDEVDEVIYNMILEEYSDP